MRVIGGSLRSRVLAAPVGMGTRPTADRLRETLFNVLTQGVRDRVAGFVFLDLYAGSGAVGIEAMSRGAAGVTFVESSAGAFDVLKKNLDGLGLKGANVRVEKRSVGRYLKAEAGTLVEFGVVFLDPPYEMEGEYALALGLLGEAGLGEGVVVVAEHRRKLALEASYGKLVRTRVVEQGDAGLSFYEVVDL